MSGTGKQMRGDGQVALFGAYSLLALAATGRSAFELATKFDKAPWSYSLSAVAAAVYLIALWAIARGDSIGLRVARIACTFELAGVLVVGTLTVVNGDLFPVETVWSYYGVGYGFLPLVMPGLALWWLSRRGRVTEKQPVSA